MMQGAIVVLALACTAMAAADPAKLESHPIQKVLEMLADVQAQVTESGDAEARTYDKFACFCKDTTDEKLDAIEKGEDQVKGLAADIGNMEAHREELDQEMDAHLKAIAEAEEIIKKESATRKKERKAYEENEAELVQACDSLAAAIEVLKAAKAKYSLTQLRAVVQTVRAATLMADAMGLTTGKNKRALAFLQGEANPEVPMEDYSFHLSDDVVELLEGLLKDFKKEKLDAEDAEVQAQQEHDMLMQDKEDVVKTKKAQYEAAKTKRATLLEEIASTSKDHSATAAQLADDQQYMTRLAAICQNKAKTWDQRSKARADELNALAEAMKIIKGVVTSKASDLGLKLAQRSAAVHLAREVARSPGAMDAIEAETEEQFGDSAPAISFLAVSSRAAPAAQDDGRAFVEKFLRSQGAHLKSQMLTELATKISTDHFAKVKTLIEELIARLQKQAENEATQKGWCDTSTAEGEAKRDQAAGAIVELNSAMARAEAERDELTVALKAIQDEISELEESQAAAKKMREDEKAENSKDMTDATEGLEAVTQAIKVLETYYNEAAKGTVSLLAGPEDDAPDAGFKGGEAYKGSASGGGVIGMLEVIQSDFERSIASTQAAEEAAQQDFDQFMLTTTKSLEAKKKVESSHTSQLNDLVALIAEKKEALGTKVDLMNEAIKELLELKAVCVDTAMSYADRAANREEEIQALRQADCILDNYGKYGPDAAGDAC